VVFEFCARRFPSFCFCFFIILLCAFVPILGGASILFFRNPCFLSCWLSNVTRFIWLSVNRFSVVLVPSAFMTVTGPLRCAL